jgi:hypothetical protein
MTDKENEKITSQLKVMTRSEVINDLLKLLGLVQKHADKEGCQHYLDLLESVQRQILVFVFANCSLDASARRNTNDRRTICLCTNCIINCVN